MRVAIDGCDGTGKTTITEKLANKFGCNIVRLTHGGDRSLKAYFELMATDNVVHDRTFISEIIYPKYFGRKSRLGDNYEEYLLKMIENKSIKLFILTARPDVIQNRIRERGDEFISNIDTFTKINHDYLEYARAHNIVIIDTTNKTIDEIVNEIGGYLQ